MSLQPPRKGWAPLALILLSLVLMAGCATPPRTPDVPPGTSVWTGRMALRVQDNASQSFSAGFELKGSPDRGELALFTPLGGTLALLSWSPGVATLRSSNGTTRQFASLEELAAQATGTAIPVAALFDWLAGVATSVPGWETDLSQLAQGRLLARRLQPPPAADLRVALDR